MASERIDGHFPIVDLGFGFNQSWISYGIRPYIIDESVQQGIQPGDAFDFHMLIRRMLAAVAVGAPNDARDVELGQKAGIAGAVGDSGAGVRGYGQQPVSVG